MAKLHDDEIAGLDHGQRLLPVAHRHVGAAAEATDSPIYDVDLRLVKVSGNWFAPATLAVSAVARSIAHSGIANEKQ